MGDQRKYVHIGKGHDVMINSHVFKSWLETMIFHHDPMTFTNLDILFLKANDLLFSEKSIFFTVAITKKIAKF